MTLFATVEMAPRDPILGLNEQFNADPNPSKVNLGVGVYYDENGKLPLLKCVAAAEKALIEQGKPKGYLPIDGIAAYDKAVQDLVFGSQGDAGKALVASGRVATVQAIGGTGGLKVGADFLKRLNPTAKVMISDPSWENHRALFTNAGFTVEAYPYYDAAARGVNVSGMLAALNTACLLPQPHRLRPDAGTVGRRGEHREGPRPGRLLGHGLPGLWRRHRPGRRGGGPVHGRRLGLLRLHQLLQELFDVRRARGRTERGV
jgi:hypothetical protein